MLSWLIKRSEVTVGAPASVVAGLPHLLQQRQGSRHTWDFDIDHLSQTAANVGYYFCTQLQ